MDRPDTPGMRALDAAWEKVEERIQDIPVTASAGSDIPRRHADTAQFEPAFDGLPFTAEDAEAFAVERFERMMARLRVCESLPELREELSGSFCGSVGQALCIGALAVQQDEVPS